jgi:pimeloyl-ACP methyl ester carboxylesterase
VLVAGWPQTLHAWRFVQPKLASKGFRVIAIDPPGIGGSDMLPDGSLADTRTVAGFMSALIKTLEIREFTLVGHDVGAWISYAWAVFFPESLKRVCLTEAAIPGVVPPAAFGLQNASRVFQFYFCATPALPEILTAL